MKYLCVSVLQILIEVSAGVLFLTMLLYLDFGDGEFQRVVDEIVFARCTVA